MPDATTYPPDWEVVPVKALGEIKSGGTPSRHVPTYWNGTIPWVTPTELTGLKNKYLRDTRERITPAGLTGSAATLLPAGSLLVTTRATIGSVAIAGKALTTNQGFKNIVPSEETDSDFYYYCLQTLVPEMYRRAIGSTFQEISKTEFERISAPRPKKPEQAAIAGILDTVDEAIRQTAAVIEKLKKIKAGLLHDLLTRGIDEDGQLRDPVRHPEQFKESPLGKVPKAWEVLRVGDLLARTGGHVQTGPFGSQLHAFEYVAAGIPVVMPQDINTDGQITLDAIARITPSKAKTLSRHFLAGNDLVFARRGELSRCAPVRERETGWLCGTGCLLMRPSRNAVLADWFTAVYRHAICQRQIAARAVGSTMVNLNTGLILGLVIPYPEPDEQERIVQIAHAHDVRAQEEEATLRKLTLMKQGLMQDLLTGRVRVKGPSIAAKNDGKAGVR